MKNHEYVAKVIGDCLDTPYAIAGLYGDLTYIPLGQLMKERNMISRWPLEAMYDVGLVCVQNYCNYGCVFDNYSLYMVLKDMKLSIQIIRQPLESEIKPGESFNFIIDPFKKSDYASVFNTTEDMRVLNEYCKKILIGSDNMFNYDTYNKISDVIKLKWVDDNVGKICYATSFGYDILFGSEDEQIDFFNSISRFDAVSVREKFAKNVFEKYDIPATLLISPIFLCDDKHYLNLIENCPSTFHLPKKYIFAYILDPDIQKEQIVQHISSRTNLEVIAISDMWRDLDNISGLWSIKTEVNIKNEEWLKSLINSSFVVTDSYIGTCLAIKFKKQFISIQNILRGSDRFSQISEDFGLSDYIINEDTPLDTICLEAIDYKKIDAIVVDKVNLGKDWLNKQLNS